MAQSGEWEHSDFSYSFILRVLAILFDIVHFDCLLFRFEVATKKQIKTFVEK